MQRRPDRRTVLASAAALTVPLAGCPSGSDDSTPTDDGPGASSGDSGSSTDGTSTGSTDDSSVELAATQLATGLGSPTDTAPLDGGDLLVAEQPGRVSLVADGEARVLLDIQERVVDVSGYDERGLLGVEPHPAFGENGRLFVRYSAPPGEATPSGYSHSFVLAEFAVDTGSMAADPDSERSILEIPEPQGNHNAGPLTFGPDGLLYVPVGDGGGANDQGTGHVEDWYDPVAGGNGQDTSENLLGSMLRIDVDGEDGDRAYAIPDDNPLVGEPDLDEHYAWGLRNPWGISFGPEGRLFVADVGQDRFEEINIVERGGNYGWNVREGPACFQAADCPTVTPDGEQLREPIVAYGREGGDPQGVAVVGGHLYDGSEIPGLQGEYVFGDWQMEGRLFVASNAGTASWSTRSVPVVEGSPGSFLLTIGRDAADELVIGTVGGGAVTEDGGELYRLSAA